MMTSSNGNMFRVTGFCAGNSPVTAGSPVTGEFLSHRPVTRSFGVFFDLRLNKRLSKQDAGDLRRHRAHYDVIVMWCRIVIQWSGQTWDLSAFNASLMSNFELVKRVKLGGSVHYGRNGIKFDTHCSTLITISWNWLYFALSGSLSLWCQIIHKFWVREEIDEIYVLYKNEWPACYAYYQYHPQCLLYGRDGRKRRRSYTRITLDNNHTAYKHICLHAGDRLCVCQKLPTRNNATIVIKACNHRQCWKSKWCNHRQGHIFLMPLLHRMGIK